MFQPPGFPMLCSLGLGLVPVVAPVESVRTRECGAFGHTLQRRTTLLSNSAWSFMTNLQTIKA